MTSPPVAALSYLVSGQAGAHHRRVDHFTEAERQHYLDLLSAVFVLAVDRRFGPEDDTSIIRFVASVRERFDPNSGMIDPGVAETLIHAALGRHDTLPGTAENITTQTVLVVALINDEDLSPDGLDALVREADATIRAAPEPPAAKPG